MDVLPIDKNTKNAVVNYLLKSVIPLEFVIMHPIVSLSTYFFINAIFWLQLSRLSPAPTDNMMATRSDTHQTAALIDDLFGDNENQFSLHRSSKLGMWLEIIVLPKHEQQIREGEKVAQLLNVNSIKEVHKIDRIIRNLTIVNNNPRKGAGKLSLLSKYKFSDICLQQTPGVCSVDGSFILEDEFLLDVEYEDLSFSRSGYYSYPRKGLPNYGRYMFGKHITKSKYGMIFDVNALRFRYNIRGGYSSRQSSKTFNILYVTNLSRMWEKQVTRILNEIPLQHINIIFASSTMLSEVPVEQGKQGLPYMIASIICYIIFTVIFIASLSKRRQNRYRTCTIAVCSSFTLPFTILGVLTLFHYRPSMPSIVCGLLIAVLGVIYFAMLLSKFEYVSQLQCPIDNIQIAKSAYNAMFQTKLQCLAIVLCSAAIIGFVSSMPDVHSCALILVIGVLILTVHTLIVYLPICMFVYRSSEMENKNRCNKIQQYCFGERSSVSLLRDCHEPVNITLVTHSDNAEFSCNSKVFNKSQQKVATVLSDSTCSTVFTLSFTMVLFLACIFTTVYKSRQCNLASRSLEDFQQDDATGTNRFVQDCKPQTMIIIRQSDLMSPSIMTYNKQLRSLIRKYRHNNFTLPISDLYRYLVETEDKFSAGAPIQIIYTSSDLHANSCSTIKSSDFILNECKSLPAIDDKFAIAWYRVFKGKIKRTELIGSIFKPDVVCLPSESSSLKDLPMPPDINIGNNKDNLELKIKSNSSYESANFTRSTEAIVANSEIQEIPCSFVKHYRIYCSFKDMRITLLSIQNMHRFKKTIRKINEVMVLPEKRNSNDYSKLQYNGTYSSFSLIYPLMDLMYETGLILVVAVISISMFICLPKLMRHLQALLLFAISFLSIRLSLKSCHRCASQKQHHNQQSRNYNRLTNVRITLLYFIITVECMLSPFIYFCLSGIAVSFMNISCVIVGFTVIPVCVSTYLVIELTRFSSVNVPDRSTINIPSKISLSSSNEIINTVKFQRNSGFIDRERNCEVPLTSSIRNDDHFQHNTCLFFYHAAYPILASVVPIIAFFVMIPFTDSPLFRSAQHACLFLWIKCIFDSVFLYPMLKRIVLEAKLL
ncbi:hypothetical protein GJ496_011388 [Pomphorhynchus laevis]|nr:hypothetical protein GJ496_011388 [Pomphorhynchus laevis]